MSLLLGRIEKRMMIYTHMLNRGGRGVESPADHLLAGIRSPAMPPSARGLAAASVHSDLDDSIDEDSEIVAGSSPTVER